MKTAILSFFLTLAVTAGAALAAPRTITLDVQNMTCAVCPLTVKKALEQVSGVQGVTVDYASKTVTVQFDDALATADKLTGATTAAGYPSTLKESGK
jgi:mercuric ion binding protein